MCVYVVTNVCVCSGSDGRHAGGDLREGEGGDHGGERARRVGAASRAAVSPPPPTSASVPRPPPIGAAHTFCTSLATQQ